MDKGEFIPADTPRVRRARYDSAKRILVIDLDDGRDLFLPPALVPGLSKLTDDELEFYEIIKDGTAIRWERHDMEISIPDFARSVHAPDNEFARLFSDEPPASLRDPRPLLD